MTTPHTVRDALKRLAADPHLQPELTVALGGIVTELESILPKSVAERGVELSPAVSEDLTRRFTYHPPKPGQPEIYAEIRRAGHDLAVLISSRVPPGRELSSAITKIEEAIFWANAGIARHGT